MKYINLQHTKKNIPKKNTNKQYPKVSSGNYISSFINISTWREFEPRSPLSITPRTYSAKLHTFASFSSKNKSFTYTVNPRITPRGFIYQQVGAYSSRGLIWTGGLLI